MIPPVNKRGEEVCVLKPGEHKGLVGTVGMARSGYYQVKFKAEEGGEDNLCPICLEVLPRDPTDPSLFVAPCGGRHMFHAGCLRLWSNSRASAQMMASCPVCRERIPITALPGMRVRGEVVGTGTGAGSGAGAGASAGRAAGRAAGAARGLTVETSGASAESHCGLVCYRPVTDLLQVCGVLQSNRFVDVTSGKKNKMSQL